MNIQKLDSNGKYLQFGALYALNLGPELKTVRAYWNGSFFHDQSDVKVTYLVPHASNIFPV